MKIGRRIDGYGSNNEWGEREPRAKKSGHSHRSNAVDHALRAELEARTTAPAARRSDAAPSHVQPGNDAELASALTHIASSTTNPQAKAIFAAASTAASRPQAPQVRINGLPEWPERLSGSIRRRYDEKQKAIVTTFVPDASTTADGEVTPVLLDERAARGLPNGAYVKLVRDHDAGLFAYTLADDSSARSSTMLGTVQKKGDKLVLVAMTEFAAYREVELKDAPGVKHGDTVIAEVRTDDSGKLYAVPDSDPRWKDLSPQRLRALKIVIDEAGIDAVMSQAVRDTTTALLEAKPLTLEALNANGYEDLTHINFFSTDNPDHPGGTPSRDFDQAVAVEPREGGGFVVYRALADPGYFVDLFPKNGVRDPVAQRAIAQQLTAYFHPDDAPIYDRRFCEIAMSLNAGVVRPSFVMRMELDANGRMVCGDDGNPLCTITNAAINVRHNGNYWSSQEYLDGGSPADMPAAYRAFWDRARAFGELANVQPHGEDDLLSKAIESQFSRVANSAIAQEIEELLKKHGLYDKSSAKCLSRVQEPPERERISSYLDIVDALGLRLPPAPPLVDLVHGVEPNDDRWPELAKELGMPENPPQAIYDVLAEIASAPNDPRADGITHVLWTPREQIRLLIQSEGADPRLSDILSYNYIRRQHKASVSATFEGHYDIGVRKYAWVTAPMRRTVDAVNQRLWRALKDEKLEEAKTILAEMPAIARMHDAVVKRVDFASREIARAKTAEALKPHIGKVFSAYVRHIALEGVEVSIPSLAMTALIPMKWLTKKNKGESPKPTKGGIGLELHGEPYVTINQDVNVKIDFADADQRRIGIDLLIEAGRN